MSKGMLLSTRRKNRADESIPAEKASKFFLFFNKSKEDN
jgi:hypothetical protein